MVGEEKTLTGISKIIKTRFEESKRVLSFEDYLKLVNAKPSLFLRNAGHYIFDAIESFGSYEVNTGVQKERRYKVFDQEYLQNPNPIYGQQGIQQELMQHLTGFVRTGHCDKVLVFHGPNGAAKSSFLRAIVEGVEHYSYNADGALFCFSWVFPIEQGGKGTLGISPGVREVSEAMDSYADLDPSKVGALIRSELHENPIFLIPKEHRKALFIDWLEATSDSEEKARLKNLEETFLQGELSQKNAMIFESLLSDYKGDFQKVLRHVRVERLYLSRRFRRGLATVEAKFGVDANIRQVTLDRSLANLPAALQSLNLFQLEGDLIDGNRGIVEFDDFLKRPIEHFKYLLGTCEKGFVNLAHVVAYIDTVFLATTNDRQLEAFREHPEYNSFKARLELIRVPYLLRYSEEEKIYKETASRVVGNKELLPHTCRVLALWAVMTRLKPPLLKNKNTTLTRILENLTPQMKAKLYDSGELPEKINEEERRELKNHIQELMSEHQTHPYYEGLFGASARELKAVLKISAQNEQFATLGPNAIFAEIKKMVKNNRDLEFLRQEPYNGFFDFLGMIHHVKTEWLNWVEAEVSECLELDNKAKHEELLGRYVGTIVSFVQKESVKNRITGKYEAPDESFLKTCEEMLGIQGNAPEFRSQVVSKMGAWSIENPGWDKAKGLPFAQVFPDLLEKLIANYQETQSRKLKAMGKLIVDVGGFEELLKANPAELSEAAQHVLKAYTGLQSKYAYGPLGAREVLTELVKSRYV